MLSIQTNVSSMNAQENLRMTNDFQARTISRLTSGFRINQSGDDAAGLAVANKFRSDIAELTQGVRNANDGLSTMQIIDGGLSNISQMLDRLKTLSTQSSSSGFEGDRNTLDREFQALLTEIDRQASNIGLSANGGSGSRYNKNLNIYLGGGGNYAANSGVQVDLSSATDRVTSTALGLTGQSILGGDGTNMGTAVTGNVTTNQAFSFVVEGSTFTANVVGGANVTMTDAIGQLNNQIGSYGLRAGIVRNGAADEVKIFSDKAFSVESTGGGVIAGATALTTNTDVNKYTMLSTDMADLGSGTTATDQDGFQIQFADGTSKTIKGLTNTDNIDTWVNTLNTNLKDNGVSVIKSGTSLVFMSKKENFKVAFTNDTDSTPYTNAASGTAYVAATTATNPTKKSEAALAAVNDAVSKLGIVQGKIGTAQNKLNYAIQLAQSQITNFSAAESRIRDADIASEAANLTKAQVLSQASMAALAQANSAPQSVLSLLRG